MRELNSTFVIASKTSKQEYFGGTLREPSSLFRTAAAVVWLLSIFQSRRGKRDKPEDVASTCPASVKLVYKRTAACSAWTEKITTL